MESAYELRIKPSSGLVPMDWRGLWEYRDLLRLLIRRDFVSKYKQTVLGPAWFIIQPLFITILFTVIFAKVAKISTDGLPPLLFYQCGMLAWSYFANTFNSTSSTLVSNAGLFGKVYFPRLIIPLSTTISNLFAFAVQFGMFAAFWIYFKYFTAAGSQFGAQWSIVVLPLVILHIGALSLGVGLLFSALTAKYRDFALVAGFLVQLWMYATPVIFPLSIIPEEWRWLILVNPMTMPVECFKQVLLGTGGVVASYYGLSIATTLLLLLSGLLLFQKVERTFVDTV